MITFVTSSRFSEVFFHSFKPLLRITKRLRRTGRCLCKKNMHSHKDPTFFKCRLTHFTAAHQANKFSQNEHCHWPNQNSVVKSFFNFRLQEQTKYNRKQLLWFDTDL